MEGEREGARLYYFARQYYKKRSVFRVGSARSHGITCTDHISRAISHEHVRVTVTHSLPLNHPHTETPTLPFETPTP